MAGTWNGIGTKYYGSRDQYPDGSFITTEWFVILFLPIIPLGSKRVIYMGTSHRWRTTTTQYMIIQNVRLAWKQVFSIYFLAVATLVISFYAGRFAANLFTDEGWKFVAGIFGFLIPFVISFRIFFDAKPSKNIARPIQPKTSINIANIGKPNILPPTSLSEPDLQPLEPLIHKYEPILNKFLNDPYGKPPEWMLIKKAMDDVIF